MDTITLILLIHRTCQCFCFHPLWHRQAESQEKQVASTGKHFDRDSHHRRKHRSLVRNESMASQDPSQEIQVWDTFDSCRTDSIMYLFVQTVPITFIPDFQRNIHIFPYAFNIVSVEDFRILSFQDTALATRFTIVQTFPGFEQQTIVF